MNHEKSETRESSSRHVADVAKRALSPHFSDGEVPPALLEAVAAGQGNREEVRRITEKACGSGKPFDLVLFDTDRISDYVFESSRPPVIAGASKILDDLNQSIGDEYRDSTIYSGGGEGILLVLRGDGERICSEIEERFRTKTDGALTVTTGWLEISPHDFIATTPRGEADNGARLVSGTQAVLSRLRDLVREKKDGRSDFRSPVHAESERCASCRDRKADSIPIKFYRDEVGRICEPCWVRWGVGKELIEGWSFDELAEKYQKALGSEGAKTRYLGFVYADGNSMGALFGRLESLSDLRFLSHSVRDAFAMTRGQVKEEVQRLVPVPGGFPLLSYLGGGDEAIWILPAALAVHITEKLPLWVEAASQRIPDFLTVLKHHGVSRVTLGTGLVICDLGYPVRYQYRLAKDLQKRAKAMFYARQTADVTSSLDFEVLTDSSPLSDELGAVRELAYKTADSDFLRTCRPYTERGFQELLNRMRQARAPRNGNGKVVRKPIANSQLYGLQSGAAEGKAVFLNYLRYQLARKPAGPTIQDWMDAFNHKWTDPQDVERFFVDAAEGGKTGTWIPDGLQLAPFLDQLRKLEDAKERR